MRFKALKFRKATDHQGVPMGYINAPKGHPSHYGYIRFVRMIRWVLPAIALVLGILLFSYPAFRSVLPDSSFSLLEWRVTNDLQKKVSSFQYSGIDNSNKPYRISAFEVVQESEEQKPVYVLEQPQANILTKNGKQMALSAAQGDYEKPDEVLKLAGDVNLYQDRDFELQTSRATLYLQSGMAEGDAQVQGEGSFGYILAEGFKVIDEGAVILFTGKAHLSLLPITDSDK